MANNESEKTIVQNTELKPYLSPFGALALGLGTSIGWGSLFITSSTYLPSAGAVCSIIGLIAGAAIMMIIAKCYHYMM
ncbi:MAG: hypothetical protein IJ736_15325, partial [Firmicutes bacterium]|nr:hypothetical protein [Bacillota bacterium]